MTNKQTSNLFVLVHIYLKVAMLNLQCEQSIFQELEDMMTTQEAGDIRYITKQISDWYECAFHH